MRTLNITDQNEIKEILKSCKSCFVAMSEDNKPYSLPMNFGLDGDHIILHSAQQGRMWETLKKNPDVCINWLLGEELVWQDERVGCSYRMRSKSIVAEGKAEFIDDYDEKYRLLKLTMAQYSDRNFEFGRPAVLNVGVLKVHVNKLSAKAFGVPAK